MNFISSFVCCNDDPHDDEGEMLFLQELGFGDNNNSRLGSEDSLHWNIDRSKVYSLFSGSNNNSSHSNNNNNNNNNNNSSSSSSSNHSNISGDNIIHGMSGNMFSFNPLQNIGQNPASVDDNKDGNSNRIMKQSTGMMVALNTPLNASLMDKAHQAIAEEESQLPVLMDDEEKALIERAIAEESFDGSVSSSVHDLEMYDDQHLLSVDQFWNAVSYNSLGSDCGGGGGGGGGDELSILQEIESMIASVTDPVGKFLRSRNLNARQVLDLNLHGLVLSAPKTHRQKYGRRFEMTTVDKQMVNRGRNREHARATRIRRKVFEQIDAVLDSMLRNPCNNNNNYNINNN